MKPDQLETHTGTTFSVVLSFTNTKDSTHTHTHTHTHITFVLTLPILSEGVFECGWLIPILSHHISHFEIEPTQKVVDLKLPVCFDLDFQLVVIVQIVEHKGLVPYRGHRLLLHRRFLFGAFAVPG